MMKKNEKGITLVALVITIIVLLILAGVALSMVAGNEGILTKAETAVTKTTESTAKEQVELMVAEMIAGFYEAKYVTKDPDVMSMSGPAYIASQFGANGLPTPNGEYFVTISDTGAIEVYEGETASGDPFLSGGFDDNGKVIWPEAESGEGEQNQS